MSSSIIAGKMENIKAIFQSAQDLVSKHENLSGLLSKLESENSEFLSVAYEAASMEFALMDFANGNSMQAWNAFMATSETHASQVHVGLGWAVAKEKPADLSFINNLYPRMQFRVWDGCGYYDGIFRQRQVVKNQLRPDYVPEKDLNAYDQGLGRSLWYSCKGDENKIPDMIRAFAPACHPDLWRGIGIACSYVGGCDKAALKALAGSAGKHSIQLGIGAAMVAKARVLSGCVTPDIALSCNEFCNTGIRDAMEMINKAETISDYSFGKFLGEMEKEILKVNEIA